MRMLDYKDGWYNNSINNSIQVRFIGDGIRSTITMTFSKVMLIYNPLEIEGHHEV